MAKGRKKPGKKERPKKEGRKKKGVTVYDANDERAYSNEQVPNKLSDDYFHDEVDEFHAKRDKILLDMHKEESGSENEEEVLGLDSDDSEDEFAMYRKVRTNYKKDWLASDLEDDEEGRESSDEKSWGKKKSSYYGADIRNVNQLADLEDEDAVAGLEEQEALEIQRKMAEQLDEADFGLEFLQSSDQILSDDNEETVTIAKDFSKMTRKEKLKLLQKESPELLELINDCKAKLKEVQRLQPIQNEILKQEGSPTDSDVVHYVTTKIDLCSNYCVNLIFYFMLKAKRSPIQNHPVISRIIQYRKLFEQLEPVDESMSCEVDILLEGIKNNKPLVLSSPPKSKRKRAVTFDEPVANGNTKLSELVSDSLESDQDDDEEYQDLGQPVGGRSWGRKRPKVDSPERFDKTSGAYEFDEDDVDAKRGITYQIEKNKGLTPHRKKEYRNPRVKHKLKYRKAIIRRKGMVREPRTEMHRYDGEHSGIRAGIKRSTKLK